MGSCFERCYVALLVALWLELERLGAGLDAVAAGASAADVDVDVELGVEIFLLELALLDTAGDRWRSARLVTPAQRQLLRELVAALRPLVAAVTVATGDAAAAPLAQAQNLLFHEIRAWAEPLAAPASRAG